MAHGKSDPCCVAAPGFAVEQHGDRAERLGSVLWEGKTAQLFIQTTLAELCLLQNTASAVSTRDRDFSLLFIKGSCKRKLCSIINRLPDTSETLDLEDRLSCYSLILNILLLQLSLKQSVDHCIHQKSARNTSLQKNSKHLRRYSIYGV